MFSLKQRMNNHEVTMIDIREDTTQILASLQARDHFDRHSTKQRDRSRESNVFVDSQSSQNDFSIDTTKEERFKIVDVEYFDLYLLDSYSKSDVIIFEKKTIYQDVHLFVEVVKNIAKLMKYQATRIRLHRCLRDIAQK